MTMLVDVSCVCQKTDKRNSVSHKPEYKKIVEKKGKQIESGDDEPVLGRKPGSLLTL